MLTTSVNNSWTEKSWCAIVPHLVSPSSFVSPRVRWATGSSYCSPCRRSYESSEDPHGARNSIDRREEHAGERLVSHLRARWLAGRSFQGAKYGPEFLCDPRWWGDRPGTGGAGGSGRCRSDRGDEPDLTQAGGSVSQPGNRDGPSVSDNRGTELLCQSRRIV